MNFFSLHGLFQFQITVVHVYMTEVKDPDFTKGKKTARAEKTKCYYYFK